MTDLLGNQLVIAAVGATLMQWLKDSKWFPLITSESEKLNKLFAAVLAALASAGILWANNWEASTATLTITISGLTASNVLSFLWHTASQYIYLKGAYKLFIKNGSAPVTPNATQ